MIVIVITAKLEQKVSDLIKKAEIKQVHNAIKNSYCFFHQNYLILKNKILLS